MRDKRPIFYEPGCDRCSAHHDYYLNRYCAGFKNKTRRKAFRKRDSVLKPPDWCPKRKNPCEYCIYSYVSTEEAYMAYALNHEQNSSGVYATASSFRYYLRCSGTVITRPKAFYEALNDPLGAFPIDETLQDGDVIELDTGLAQFFFLRTPYGEYKPVYYFNVEKVQRNEVEK